LPKVQIPFNIAFQGPPSGTLKSRRKFWIARKGRIHGRFLVSPGISFGNRENHRVLLEELLSEPDFTEGVLLFKQMVDQYPKPRLLKRRPEDICWPNEFDRGTTRDCVTPFFTKGVVAGKNSWLSSKRERQSLGTGER